MEKDNREERPQRDLDRLRISISGDRNELSIGKYVVRILDTPAYMAFRVNKARDSIIVLPSSEKEMLSFRVPSNIYGKNGRQFRIISKGFIKELIDKNNLSGKNFVVPGTYVEDRNLVVFNLADGYVHTVERCHDAV